jgi:signal transduction histidine kinase
VTARLSIGEPADSPEGLLGDLVVLATLPALWIERRPERILDDALTLLRRMRSVELACGELGVGSGPQQHIVPSVSTDEERALAAIVHEHLPRMRPQAREAHTLETPAGALRVIIAPIGVADVAGTLAIGSFDPLFPRRADRVLLDVGANQVGIALKTASLIEQLRQSDQRKDEFLATLAHELRNPLSAINSAVGVLGRDGADRGTERSMLDLIARQLRHLTRMVDDLLDVSRLTRGSVALVRVPTDVRGVVERAVGGLRMAGRFGERGVLVDLGTRPLVVNADETRIEQVVSNLLDNAIKHTAPTGTVRIEAGVVGTAAEIRVADDGVGIPADFLPHVFELFSQAPRPLDRSSGGLGIGLAVVREIAQLHDGWARAESAGLGLGSTFVLTLPLSNGDASPTRMPAPASVLTTRRIVLVEDNSDALEALRQLLEFDGHDVRTAKDGVSGRELIASALPDIAFVDVGLPQMDGYAVARGIRDDPRCDRVSLVAVTGYGQDTDRKRALAAGFDAHVVKPVDATVLARMLADPPRRGDRR